MRLMYFTVAVLSLTAAAQANPVQFDTHSYNFVLTGGGGGEAGVLSSDLRVETYRDNFNNEISVPHADYSAYISTLTDGSNLSNTRFGSNASSKTITLSDGDPNDATDAAIINQAGALARYQIDSTTTSAGAAEPLSGGFQEQLITIVEPVPEPRAAAWMLMGLFSVFACTRRSGLTLSPLKISG